MTFLLYFFIYLLIGFLVISVAVYKNRLAAPEGFGAFIFSIIMFPMLLVIILYDYAYPISKKMMSYLDSVVVDFFDWLKK